MKTTKLSLFRTGYCVHPEKIAIKDGSMKSINFPALVGLIQHPEKGYILFDTGYSDHFFQASNRFPYSIYPKVTPVTFIEGESIKEQLCQIEIQVEDIQHIFISHFHADHIGGLLDFPHAKYYCSKKGYEFIKNLKGMTAVRNGILPNLLPSNFEEQAVFIEEFTLIELPDEFFPFNKGWDLFGDASVFVVDLTGHAIGQLGLFLRDQDRGYVFLCADACWLSRAYREKVFPHPFAHFIMPDVKNYKYNLERLHELNQKNPAVSIIPTHCMEIWEEMK